MYLVGAPSSPHTAQAPCLQQKQQQQGSGSSNSSSSSSSTDVTPDSLRARSVMCYVPLLPAGAMSASDHQPKYCRQLKLKGIHNGKYDQLAYQDTRLYKVTLVDG
jgi:hypothetical protein